MRGDRRSKRPLMMMSVLTVFALTFLSRPSSSQTACVTHKAVASDGASFDGFGRSVAIDGDVAIIGAPGDDDNGGGSGSAYILRFDGSGWQQEGKLLASDGAALDAFGWSVAISGNVALSGVFRDDDNGNQSGSAYVFRYDGSRWIQEQKLLPSDGGSGDSFGISVGVSGDIAAVGAVHDSGSGSAYIFRFDGLTWIEEQKLLANDGATGDLFGQAIAVSGNFVTVGALGNGDNGPGSGSAYVFALLGSTWVQQQKLLPTDGESGDNFGSAVALFDDIAVVGARRDDDAGTNNGSAYVFRFNGFQWLQEQKLLPDKGPGGVPQGDLFGASVALSAQTALVGAPFSDDSGDDSGSAYVFRFDGLSWAGDRRFPAPDGAALDTFGFSVALSSDTALIGAVSDDDNGETSGSAYVLELNPPPGDANCDGVVNILDLIDLLLCFGQMADPPCDTVDVNDDGVVDVLDLIELLLSFGQPP